MIDEYRTLKENFQKREEEIKSKLEQIKAMRSEMKQLHTGTHSITTHKYLHSLCFHHFTNLLYSKA